MQTQVNLNKSRHKEQRDGDRALICLIAQRYHRSDFTRRSTLIVNAVIYRYIQYFWYYHRRWEVEPIGSWRPFGRVSIGDIVTLHARAHSAKKLRTLFFFLLWAVHQSAFSFSSFSHTHATKCDTHIRKIAPEDDTRRYALFFIQIQFYTTFCDIIAILGRTTVVRFSRGEPRDRR